MDAKWLEAVCATLIKSAGAMTAPRTREQADPPSPPAAPLGRPSLISDRIRRRPAGARRGLVRPGRGGAARALRRARPSERGLEVTVRQSLGAAASGDLLGRRTMAGLVRLDDGGSVGRLDAKLGHGLPVLGNRFAGTPWIGVGLSKWARLHDGLAVPPVGRGRLRHGR